MRWKVFFGLSLAFLLGLFLTQSSFAASSSMTVSESSLSGLTAYTAIDVGFSFKYVLFHFYGGGLSGRATGPCYYWNSTLTASECPQIYFDSGDNLTLLSVRDSKVGLQPGYGWNTVDITFYDSDPFASEPCPECPPVPDLPYGEKLDKLTNAVIIVAATMLVLYFFFAIYNMFFKGLK